MLGDEKFESAALCVRDVMTQTVITLTADQSVPEALAVLARHRFRHLLVLDGAQQVVGVLSDCDLLRAVTRRRDADQIRVAEVMQRQIVSVRPEAYLSTAAAMLLQHRINCVPVLDAQVRLCGILTSTDLLQVFQQLQQQIEKHLKASAGPPAEPNSLG